MIEIELIIGTMGLKKIFHNKFPRYSPALFAKASRVLKEFDKSAKELSMKSPNPVPNDVYSFSDYDELKDMIHADRDHAEVIDGLATWPDQLQMPLVALLSSVKEFLSMQLPTEQGGGTLSLEFLEPSDSDKFRFLWQANLLEDITRFGELFTSSAITPIESKLMRTLFPAAHDYFVTQVMMEVVDKVVAEETADWSGGWQNPAISALLGIPIATLADTMTWQTGHAEKTAGRPKGTGSVQLAQYNLTDNQKIDTKTMDFK